jgi:hypothetical protein
MGYRSDVIIAIKKEVKAKSVLLNTKLPEMLTEEADEYTVEAIGIIYYEMEGIKWYQAYPEIIEVEDFLNTLSLEDYQFIRTGEEPGDVENHGNLEAELYAETFISKPY